MWSKFGRDNEDWLRSTGSWQSKKKSRKGLFEWCCEVIVCFVLAALVAAMFWEALDRTIAIEETQREVVK